MVQRRTVLAWGVIILFCTVPFAPPAKAQSSSRYFPESGHNIQGTFLEFFDAHDGIDVFGFPITEQFYNPQQVLVQYFQRAVMEYRPHDPAPYQVQLVLLGVLLGYQDPPILASAAPRPSDRQKRYYPQSGHVVSYAFLNFFDKHGGVSIFGYPISEYKIENGRIVQYFQRARMEWHPEKPARYKVQLGLLGNDYAHQVGLEQSRLEPTAPNALPTPDRRSATPSLAPPKTAETLACSAAVKYRVTGLRGTQMVTARIADKLSGRGLTDVEVTVTVQFPEGAQKFSGKTDQTGSANIPFDLGVQQPGLIIVVDVSFSQNGRRLSESIKTYFLTWSTN